MSESVKEVEEREGEKYTGKKVYNDKLQKQLMDNRINRKAGRCQQSIFSILQPMKKET